MCRHPLLLGDYLRHCEKLGRDRPSAPRGAKRVTAVKAAPKKVHRRLSNRKDDATIAKLTSQSGEEEKQEDGGPVNPVSPVQDLALVPTQPCMPSICSIWRLFLGDI